MTVLVVIVFNFFLFRVLPGDPARSGARTPGSPGVGRGAAGAVRAGQAALPDLDGGNPFDSQYFHYLGALARATSGISYAFNDRSVAALIGQALRNTVWLILPAQVLSILAGSSWGCGRPGGGAPRSMSARSLSPCSCGPCPRSSWGSCCCSSGAAISGFPAAGRVTIGADTPTPLESDLGSGHHLFLPTLTFTLVLLGEYMLVMRSSVVEVLSARTTSRPPRPRASPPSTSSASTPCATPCSRS